MMEGAGLQPAPDGGHLAATYYGNPVAVAPEIEPWSENGESWRRLHVRFPNDVPTHSSEQDFYFDSEGKLRRLDYTAEVFGGWAKAVHYCSEHKRFSGLLVPTRRKVFPRKRNNLPRSRPTIVWIEVDHAELV